jgi:hypothetical protein
MENLRKPPSQEVVGIAVQRFGHHWAAICSPRQNFIHEIPQAPHLTNAADFDCETL